MIRVLAIWNIIVTTILLGVLISKSRVESGTRAAEAVPVVRANRVEIVDQNGKMRAVLGIDNSDSVPKLALYNTEGREAAFLTLNSNGYGTMYFQDKKTEGKVSVGYLWGSDTPTPSDIEDPLSSWGIRVRGINGVQTSFGLLNNDQPISQSKVASSSRR
ncbi:MAG TPA: hypothetical protein VF214_05545 [Edaphobacter sp.]